MGWISNTITLDGAVRGRGRGSAQADQYQHVEETQARLCRVFGAMSVGSPSEKAFWTIESFKSVGERQASFAPSESWGV